ncbi:MAG TPA: hypothetical protein VG815_05525 [Chloroflexota bacterium]|jgi:hypothetical protein|nr:hypothetical protein [Chloroflexota bacterium]
MARLTIADLEIERNGDPLEIEMEDGTIFTFKDPKAINLNEMVSLEGLAPIDQIKAMMQPGDFDRLSTRPEVDLYFFTALLKKYLEHYRLPTPGEAPA